MQRRWLEIQILSRPCLSFAHLFGISALCETGFRTGKKHGLFDFCMHVEIHRKPEIFRRVKRISIINGDTIRTVAAKAPGIFRDRRVPAT